MKHTVAFAVAAILAATAGAAHAQTMRPGLWEITSQTQMPGMPAGAMPAQTMKHCVTPEAAAKPEATAPGPATDECMLVSSGTSGNAYRYEMLCKDGTRMKGEQTWKGDSYTGKTVMEMKDGDEAMTMTVTQSAKRIGDCPK